MQRRLLCRFASLALLAFKASAVFAAEVPAPQPSAQETWPKPVVVTVGDIRTRIDWPKPWTLSGIDFQDTVMATEDSAYGTVFTIRGVGHLGTAHFLDVPASRGKWTGRSATCWSSARSRACGAGSTPAGPTAFLRRVRRFPPTLAPGRSA